MQAQIETSDSALHVALDGQLTFAENGAFRQIVQALEQREPGEVVFDLAGVSYVDSAGLGMLLVARDEVVARGGRIILRAPSGQVERMLRLARFQDFFSLDGVVRDPCAQV